MSPMHPTVGSNSNFGWVQDGNFSASGPATTTTESIFYGGTMSNGQKTLT